LKIGTWNLERPTIPKFRSKRNELILQELKRVDADILILTETNEVIHPGGEYSFVCSDPLPLGAAYDGTIYLQGENRTSIWVKNKIVRKIQTSSDVTNACCEIETVFGNIIVYGTIIGTHGLVKPYFEKGLADVLNDSKRLSGEAFFCLAGDFNCSFNGYPYGKLAARTQLAQLFAQQKLVNLTAEISEIDHIVLSESLIKGLDIVVETWNKEKSHRKPRLSDHQGVCVTLSTVV
jgi:hypothetical protein